MRGTWLSGWRGLGLATLVVILLNAATYDTYLRLDLTAEGRYSLSDVTRHTLDSLGNGTLEIDFLLEGNYPPTGQRFKQAVSTLLAEYQAYAGGAMRLRSINPAESPQVVAVLDSLGFAPIPFLVRRSELDQQEVRMYPVLALHFRGNTYWIDLLKGTAAEQDLNQLLRAEQLLEYQITTALRRLVLTRRPTVGLLTGHGELTPNQMPEFMGQLQRQYRVVPVSLPQVQALVPAGTPHPNGTAALDALVVAQPRAAFSERDKYELDQYLMRGGRILWLIDPLRVSVEDLNARGLSLAEPRPLRLQDLLFRYGIKLNDDLVQDVVSSGFIDALKPTPTGDQRVQARWLYFPLVRHFPAHPLTRRLDAVLLRFASSIDTLSRPGVQLRPLLVSSPYALKASGTLAIDFIRTLVVSGTPPPEELLQQPRPPALMALAAEGAFASAYENNPPGPDSLYLQPPQLPVLPRAAPGARMVVVADGDLALGNHSRLSPPGMPVDNAAFLLNALDYLVGEQALTTIRAKDVSPRTLSAAAIRGQEGLWQAGCVAGPLLGVFISGFIALRVRRRRNSRFRV